MNAAISKGSFVVIDGQDGSGKGTQIRLLREHLEKEEIQAVFTREPGGTPSGEILRRFLFEHPICTLTELLIVQAARVESIKQVVAPARSRGTLVVSDRSDSSTYAYQICGRNAPEFEEEFWRLRSLVFGECLPSAYIIIDVPSDVAIARVRAATDGEHSSVFDNEKVEFYEKVRAGFKAFKSKLPDEVHIIDGDRPPNVVHEEISYLVRDIMYGG